MSDQSLALRVPPHGSSSRGHVRTASLATADAGETAAPTRFLDRPDGRIAYDDQGSGPLVVMVPGLGDLRQEYRFLVPELVGAGYRVVTMDVRGHGESSTGWPRHRTRDVGDDIVALIASLDAGPATVVGNSMGAGAAVWAAAEAPALVGRLVLIGPFVRNVPLGSLFRSLAQSALIKIAFMGPWANAAWMAYFAGLFPTDKPADFAAYKARLSANLREPGRLDALRAMMGVDGSKADIEPRLGEVTAPALVIMGTRDPDFPDPAAEARHIASRLNAIVRMIDGAGHYPHAEMPTETAPIIIDFLGHSAAR